MRIAGSNPVLSASKSAVSRGNLVSAGPGLKTRGTPRVFARTRSRNASQRLCWRRIFALVPASSPFAFLGVPIGGAAMHKLLKAPHTRIEISSPNCELHAVSDTGMIITLSELIGLGSGSMQIRQGKLAAVLGVCLIHAHQCLSYLKPGGHGHESPRLTYPNRN